MTEGDPIEERLIDAARQAAPEFGLEPATVAILNRSENVVCSITSPDGSKVAMRLHRPGYNRADELRSEVQWVHALAAANVPVAKPVPARSGGFYSPVTIDTGSGPTEHQVGVIEWVDGQPLGDPLEAGDQDLSTHFERIGELCAQVRNQSESWAPPVGFVRRRWDADAFVGDSPLWGRFWEAPSLNDEQQVLLRSARNAMRTELSTHPIAAEHFGLIHADLHLGNVMANDSDLTLIDFDDAGFGWYAYEIAVALNNVVDEPWYRAAREAMFSGYRRFHALDGDEIQLVDTLITMRTLMIVGWLSARPELPAYEHLPDRITAATKAAAIFLSQ